MGHGRATNFLVFWVTILKALTRGAVRVREAAGSFRKSAGAGPPGIALGAA